MRLAVLTAALALALAEPAAAQDDYTPVVGSGSFNTAPILTPGRYRDTVLPEEYLYYAIKLEAGQHLHVVAASEIDRDEFAGLNLAFIATRVQTPDRLQSFDSEGDQLFTSDDDTPADFTTPAATTVAGESQGGSNGWDGPGYYFLSFYAAYVGSRSEPPKAEIPFHFEVSVEGTPETEPAATPIATPTPSPSPRPTATPAVDASGGGTSPAVAVAFGVGGLIVGGLAGLALRRRAPGTAGD